MDNTEQATLSETEVNTNEMNVDAVPSENERVSGESTTQDVVNENNMEEENTTETEPEP